jgi:hypothetical protein
VGVLGHGPHVVDDRDQVVVEAVAEAGEPVVAEAGAVVAEVE